MEAPSPLTPLTDERRRLGLTREFAVPRKVMATRGMDSIHALLVSAPRDTKGSAAGHPIGAPSRAWAATISGHAPDWLRGPSRHFRAAPTSVNTVLTFVPTVCTAVMIKTAMSEAISAYSIAVAPESSWAKFFIDLNAWVAPVPNCYQRPTRFPGARLNPTYPYPLSFKLIRIFTNDASENSVNDAVHNRPERSRVEERPYQRY